jgi:RHS repeat-associated protein
VTTETRALVERREYEPYGYQTAPFALKDGPGYTGHVTDAATGLVYMQQRYYDPVIGRFLSVDPVAADDSSGANFNRYKYAANNPYRYTDPDGRCESISTCQMERDDMDVANGKMTPQERMERINARGAGAAAGALIIAAVVVPGVRNGLVAAGLEVGTQTGKQMAVDGKSLSEVSIDKSDVAVSAVIGTVAPSTYATAKATITNVKAINVLRSQATNTLARAAKVAGRIESHVSSLKTSVGAWLAAKVGEFTAQGVANTPDEPKKDEK